MAKKETFTSVLDREMDTFERPKPAPVGTYLFQVDGKPPRIDKTPEKDGKPATDFVEFTLNFKQAMEDVDGDQLSDWGLQTSQGNAKSTRTTFYLTEDAIYRLRDFLEKAGVEKGVKLREAIAQAPGRYVKGLIAHSPSRDGETIYANVRSFSSAE